MSEGTFLRKVLVVTTALVLLAAAGASADCPEGQVESVPGSGECLIDPAAIPKYVTPLVIPPAMPRTAKINNKMDKNIDYYEIAVRQFDQYLLPQNWSMMQGIGPTTVWSYGSRQFPGTVAQGGTFNYPAFTIEAKFNKPVLVKWINDLRDPMTGTPLPHLLTGTVDQTVHWANPPGDCANPALAKDCTGVSQEPYDGPVPMVTHVHGAHVGPESDGYPEAWWLPAPAGFSCKEDVGESGDYWCRGTLFDQFDQGNTEPGTASFQYPNDQRATTLWYHDHTLGMTRLNVYAGPAGFYLLRGGPDDMVLDAVRGKAAVLPGPAPAIGDPPGMTYYEIPIVIQDRSFLADGSLFYPDNRAFFEGLPLGDLDIDFAPDSDVLPIWNPEAFFNTMVVNGGTWPTLAVEPRRYRFRFLNGCNSRFLILKMTTTDPATLDEETVAAADLSFWQIGAEGGFLPAPTSLATLLMGPAERADVIVDFSALPEGTVVYLTNEGPDEPFGGGVPGEDFGIADSLSTRQVMTFVVGPNIRPPDKTTEPQNLLPPAVAATNPSAPVRQLSLNEEESTQVCVAAVYDEEEGEWVPSVPITQLFYDPPANTMPIPPDSVDCEEAPGVAFGPTAALLGTFDSSSGMTTPLLWMDAITENPAVGATETWEVWNFTMDAHPIHLHLVQFRVLERQPMGAGAPRPPESWETGWKDTVIAYPGEITRIQATFDIEGLYVWHCHIVEHEDNEMMRPYWVGDPCLSPVPVEGAVCGDVEPVAAK